MINIRKLESELWESADLLRQGSKLTSSQYCMPVLALLFLRYAYSRYKMVEAEILQGRPIRGGQRGWQDIHKDGAGAIECGQVERWGTTTGL